MPSVQSNTRPHATEFVWYECLFCGEDHRSEEQEEECAAEERKVDAELRAIYGVAPCSRCGAETRADIALCSACRVRQIHVDRKVRAARERTVRLVP